MPNNASHVTDSVVGCIVVALGFGYSGITFMVLSIRCYYGIDMVDNDVWMSVVYIFACLWMIVGVVSCSSHRRSDRMNILTSRCGIVILILCMRVQDLFWLEYFRFHTSTATLRRDGAVVWFDDDARASFRCAGHRSQPERGAIGGIQLL